MDADVAAPSGSTLPAMGSSSVQEGGYDSILGPVNRGNP